PTTASCTRSSGCSARRSRTSCDIGRVSSPADAGLGGAQVGAALSSGEHALASAPTRALLGLVVEPGLGRRLGLGGLGGEPVVGRLAGERRQAERGAAVVPELEEVGELL